MWWAKRVTNGEYQTLLVVPDEGRQWFNDWLHNYMRTNPPGVYLIFHDPDDWRTNRAICKSGIDSPGRFQSSYADIERKVRDDSTLR